MSASNTNDNSDDSSLLLDSTVYAVGRSIGVDIDMLHQKYQHHRSSTIPIRNQTSSRNDICKSFSQKTKPKPDSTAKTSTDSKILDNLLICSRCHGTGLIDHTYNFQVRQLNCEHCDGEGLIQKRVVLKHDGNTEDEEKVTSNDNKHFSMSYEEKVEDEDDYNMPPPLY